MSEKQTDVVVVKAKRTRKPGIDAVTFWTKTVEGIKAGKSNRQIAESLGMDEDNFAVRKSQTARAVENATATFTVDGGKEMSGMEVATAFKYPIGKLHNLVAFKGATNKTLVLVKDGEKLPGSSAPRTKTDLTALAALQRKIIGAGPKQ